jgi:hypothetical protein
MNTASQNGVFRVGLTSLILAVAQTAAAAPETNTHLLLMLPELTGLGWVGRDASGSKSLRNDEQTQYTLAGISIGYDFAAWLRTELYAAIVTMDAPRPRGTIGLRAGPIVPLLRRERDARSGVALEFVTMVGLAYRGQMYEWLHADDWRGQRSVALTATPAFEATYYSSPTFGWTVRLKAEASYVIDQIGPPTWQDEEGGPQWDGYRSGFTGGLDVGVAF